MNLSKTAKTDLRKVIRESYGKELEVTLSDEELTEIGEFLLTSLAEGLKIRISDKNKYEKSKTKKQ